MLPLHHKLSTRISWRTLYVAQTILSIQRDAVCSLAKRGLVSNKEKEVLLEEVLEDLEEVFKLEEDRGHEQHGGEHGGVEHWVDAAHTLPSQDVEAHFSARPADAARMTLANSRLFGTNGAYASARARRRHAAHPRAPQLGRGGGVVRRAYGYDAAAHGPHLDGRTADVV